MKAVLLLLTGLLLALAQPAAAAWKFTYWRMTPAQVIEASEGLARPLASAEPARRIPDLDADPQLTMPYKYGALTFNAQFLFAPEGGLLGVSLDVEAPDVEQAFEVLVLEHGEPFRSLESEGRAIMVWSTADEDLITATYWPAAPNVPGRLLINVEPRP